MSKRSVVLVHVLSNIGTIIAAVAVYMLGNVVEPMVPFILAAVAGGFIYIAAADIIPDIHERPRKEANVQTACLLIGMILIPSFGYIIEQTFGIHP
jgi:zinc and cadmium transporter